MANVKPSAFGSAITPISTTILTGETAGGTAGRFTVSQLPNSDSEGVTYLAPYTGSASRTVEGRLAEEVVSANDFPGTATQKIHAAAAACAGTGKTLLIPDGTWVCSALDLTEVKHIDCQGIIKSTVAASGIAVTIGTAIDTANRMIFGDISLWVEHNNNVNTGLTGTVGILIRGASQCRFRLRSAYFDIGVSLAPQTGSSQYISDCHFTAVDTYGCRIGLDFNGNYGGDDFGWVNESQFDRVSVNPAGNALGADSGIQMRGNYASNNHVFNKPHLEGNTCPIRIVNGANNTFRDCRLETSGNIVFGDGTTTYVCANNVVQSNYTHDGSLTPKFTHTACFPNLVGGRDGVQWVPAQYTSYDDWKNNGSTWYNAKVYNNAQGKTFAAVTLNSTNRTFKLNAADIAYFFIPVNVGDVFKVSTAWTGSPAGSATVFQAVACDATFSGLAALAGGSLPYFGLSDNSSFANGTSGTGAFKATPVSTFPFTRLVSCNRSEVKLLAIAMAPDLDYKYFRVERMEWDGANQDAVPPYWQDIKFISSLATAPDFPGQVGIVTTSNLVVTAISSTAWNCLTGTATWDPASILDGDQTTTTITVTGAAVGNRVEVKFSVILETSTNALSLTGYVSATNTVKAVLQNNSGATVDLGSGTVTAYVWAG